MEFGHLWKCFSVDITVKEMLPTALECPMLPQANKYKAFIVAVVAETLFVTV